MEGAEMKEYAAVIERGAENYSAYCPDVDGCIATGKTRAEAEQKLRTALEFHFEGLRQHGYPIPEPTTEVATIAMAA